MDAEVMNTMPVLPPVSVTTDSSTTTTTTGAATATLVDVEELVKGIEKSINNRVSENKNVMYNNK